MLKLCIPALAAAALLGTSAMAQDSSTSAGATVQTPAAGATVGADTHKKHNKAKGAAGASATLPAGEATTSGAGTVRGALDAPNATTSSTLDGAVDTSTSPAPGAVPPINGAGAVNGAVGAKAPLPQ